MTRIGYVKPQMFDIHEALATTTKQRFALPFPILFEASADFKVQHALSSVWDRRLLRFLPFQRRHRPT
jgi:hypothetical protein